MAELTEKYTNKNKFEMILMPLHKAECHFLSQDTYQLHLLQNQMRSKRKGYFLSAKNNPAHDFQPNVLIKQKDKITMLKLFTETGKGVGHDRKAVCNS